MLAKRIIPCLDIDKGRVVKGVNFLNLRDAGDPVENAVYYDKEQADEIVLLDITATSDSREILFDVVKKVADSIYTPFTVGGGIRTINDMKILIQAGADKVSINSAAINNPDLITDGARRFGSQAIVVAIDAKSNRNGGFEVYIKGGRENTGLDVIEWAKKAQFMGAGEILLTSMDKDGTKTGYDVELCSLVSSAVTIPVIASGGVGKLEDFYNGFNLGKVDACLAASIFHFREYSIVEVKNYLLEKNIPVRV